MGEGIFVSYRRSDSLSATGRLCDHLRLQGFKGEEDIFLDIDNIPPGADFRTVIHDTLTKCDIVLLIIGRSWLTAVDTRGRRRLDSMSDTHRFEIRSALQSDALVIPVLVEGAQHPSVEDLPEDLSELAFRNAWEVSDRRFAADVAGLAEHLHRIRARRRQQAQPAADTAHRTATENVSPEDPPTEVTAPPAQAPAKRRRIWPPDGRPAPQEPAVPSIPRRVSDRGREPFASASDQHDDAPHDEVPASFDAVAAPADDPDGAVEPSASASHASTPELLIAQVKQQTIDFGLTDARTLITRQALCRQLHEAGFLSWAIYEAEQLLHDVQHDLGPDTPTMGELGALLAELEQSRVERAKTK